ncbi:MAG TPA: glycosyl hydrolase, partial [Prolixibacteraceae bacterium]|nr:glycosyl hydrolase [Prolixibacteraceae bacterium]
MMNCRVALILPLVFLIAGFTESSAQKPVSEWRTSFLNPPDQYRPVPFWHINGKLTTAEIEKQMEAAKTESGYGGVTVLPVSAGKQHPTGMPTPGMEPSFLSGDYFARYLDILEAAKKKGMQVILYDDIDFPSGSAGKLMRELHPNDRLKYLEKTDTLVAGSSTLNLILRNDPVMAVVAMKVPSLERVNLSRFVTGKKLQWTAPSGEWRVMVFYCSQTNHKLVDYMSPSAVAKYLPLTYGEYEKRFKDYFGTTIRQIFYDDVGYVAKERGWTPEFNRKFKERYGKDPDLYYPALYEDIGPETAAARVSMFDTRAELLSEGYPRMVNEWSEKNGLLSSGHPPGNYKLQPTDTNLDAFKFYRHTQIPLMDYIFYHTHGREGFKLISSAADVYDRPVVAAEMNGAFLEDQFKPDMLFRTAMDVFTRGVNFLIPHGMWYDYRPEAVRIPPLLSSYSPKTGPLLPSYSDFVARSCYLLQGGRRVADVAILNPITSLQAFFKFNSGKKPWGSYAPPETDYLTVGDLLTRKLHRDFTFIHPETWVSGQCKLMKDEIELGNKENHQNYKLLIVPGGKVISVTVLQKIQSWAEQGGKVIATSMLPCQSAEFGKDQEVVSIVKALFGIDPTGSMPVSNGKIRETGKGGKVAFVPHPDASSLSAIMEQMDLAADLVFESLPVLSDEKTEVSYIHKVRENRNIWYIANSS